MHTKEKIVSPLIKVQLKGQVTLPSKLRRKAGIAIGDYVEMVQEGTRIVLIPQDVAPRHLMVDTALQEAIKDSRAKKITPKFENMKEYAVWRKSSEGQKFSRS